MTKGDIITMPTGRKACYLGGVLGLGARFCYVDNTGSPLKTLTMRGRKTRSTYRQRACLPSCNRRCRMAKSYTVKGPGTSHFKVIVSDQDAHWLNAYRYSVSQKTKTLVAHRQDSQRGVKISLSSDIYGNGTRVLHVNGNPLDYRRSNCTLVTRADTARLMLLDEKIGCSFSPRRNIRAETSNV